MPPNRNQWKKKTPKKERDKEKWLKKKHKYKKLLQCNTGGEYKTITGRRRTLQIYKIDKGEKKICEGKRRGRIRKAQSERKGESETRLKLPKHYSNKGVKNKNCVPLRCKSAKCHKERYKYKTKECIELHNKLHHSQQGRKKLQELKERNYRVVFRKRKHRCWNRRGEYLFERRIICDNNIAFILLFFCDNLTIWCWISILLIFFTWFCRTC